MRTQQGVRLTHRGTLVVWFMVGFVLALGFQWQYAASYDSWTAILRLGDRSTARAFIEAELDEVTVFPNSSGHDGKYTYVVARAPGGDPEVAPLLDHWPAYRYRRILYPALAGGFGGFSPSWVIAGFVFWAAVGGGLACAAMADIIASRRLPRWAMLGVLANSGLGFGLIVATGDVLAFGLALVAIACHLRRRPGATIVALGAAGLTKETYLLVAYSLAVMQWRERRRREAIATAVLPTIPVLAWTLWLGTRLPGQSSADEAFAAPFAGIAHAVTEWSGWPLFYVLLTLAAVVLTPAFLWGARDRLLAWLALPWIPLAVLSSARVWRYDSNRIFLPLWAFMVLALAVWIERLRARDRPGAPAMR